MRVLIRLTAPGYDIVWANDIDPDACENYRENIGDIIEGDVTSLPIPELKDIDVLTSGFPRQALPRQQDIKGPLAQLGERLHGMQEVSGSIPLGSTISPKI